MVQVHTVFEASRWRNKVDGLQQGVAFGERTCAVAAGRAIAQELGGSHEVHDVDGRVLEHCDYDGGDPAVGPLLYSA